MNDQAIPAALRLQAQWCVRLGSPLTAALLDAAAEDFCAAGITQALFADFAGEPVAAALALRLAGALHHGVLTDPHSDLAKFYPSVDGHFDPDRDAATLWEAARACLQADPDSIRAFLERPPQTNEVSRSGVLLGGFLTIARHSGLPLALREVGASAGLNLLFDHYHYDLGHGCWGHPQSPVQIRSQWRGQPPALDIEPVITSRAGCDRNPLPIASEAERRRLEAYVWPDQVERLQRLRAAMALAREAGIAVAPMSADQWIRTQLDELPTGQVTVVYHSVVQQYLPRAVRSRFQAAIAEAGERATASAPLAHLRMEPVQERGATRYLLDLTLWPSASRQTLAEVHPHGSEAMWSDASIPRAETI